MGIVDQDDDRAMSTDAAQNSKEGLCTLLPGGTGVMGWGGSFQGREYLKELLKVDRDALQVWSLVGEIDFGVEGKIDEGLNE